MMFPILLSLVFGSQFSYAVEIDFERNATLPLVYLNIVVKTGSAADPVGQSGLTNLVAEMLMRGTRHNTRDQFNQKLDQFGAQIDVETRTDSVLIRSAFLKERLLDVLPLLREMVTEPSFNETELAKVKSETKSNILESLSDDESLGLYWFQKFLFESHPYGKPTIGYASQISKASIIDIEDHYKKLFQPDNLIVVGSGDATVGAIESWAASLNSIPKTTGRLPELTFPNEQTTRRVFIVDKPGLTQTQIFIGKTGIRMNYTAFFPIHLANHIFGGSGFQSTLTQEIRVKRGWSYGAWSSFRFGKVPRYWNAYLFPALKDTVNAVDVTLKLIEELKTKGISQSEFDYARSSLMNKSGFMYDTPRKRAENIILEKTLDLPSGLMKGYSAGIEGTTLTQVNLEIQKFISMDQLTIVVVGPAQDLKAGLAKVTGVSEEKIVVRKYTDEF
jgi:zinc protease